VNAANPRPENRSGHIIEIAEAGDDATATRFEWNVFLLAGDPAAGRYIVDARELAPGTLATTDTYFAGYANRGELSQVHGPDNLGVDPQGRLWMSPIRMNADGLTTAASWSPPAVRSAAGCSNWRAARWDVSSVVSSRRMDARVSHHPAPGEGGALIGRAATGRMATACGARAGGRRARRPPV
jgi:hypothetical protein